MQLRGARTGAACPHSFRGICALGVAISIRGACVISSACACGAFAVSHAFYVSAGAFAGAQALTAADTQAASFSKRCTHRVTVPCFTSSEDCGDTFRNTGTSAIAVSVAIRSGTVVQATPGLPPASSPGLPGPVSGTSFEAPKRESRVAANNNPRPWEWRWLNHVDRTEREMPTKVRPPLAPDGGNNIADVEDSAAVQHIIEQLPPEERAGIFEELQTLGATHHRRAADAPASGERAASADRRGNGNRSARNGIASRR